MCVDPITLSALAVAGSMAASAGGAGAPTLAAIGAGVSALSTIGGGVASYQVGQYRQQLANANAHRAEMTADQNELIQRAKSRNEIASQAVALAGQGTRIDTGTPLLLLGESARNAELDALAIRQHGIDQAQQYKAEGQAAAAEGENALAGSVFSAAGTLLQNKSFVETLRDI